MSISLIYTRHPAPWSLAPLDGKYYGTQIVDAFGAVVLEVWDHSYGEDNPPSIRQVEYDGGVRGENETEGFTDTHYESEADYQIAKWLVDTFNKTVGGLVT